MATLNANTVVQRGFEHVVLYKGDEIPEWAADLVGDHLIEPEGEPQPKPVRGRKAAGGDN